MSMHELIDSYQIRFGVHESGRYDTYIFLFNASGARVGMLHFYEGDAPPDCVTVYERRTANLWYPRSHFQDIVTLLRVEKPVYLRVWEEYYGFLTTNPEPEGEEEHGGSATVHVRG